MNYPNDHDGIERAHGTVYDRPKVMKPTTRKRMPAMTPDEARCLRILKRKPTTRKPHPITVALKQRDKIMARKRKHSGATCTPDARLTRLIERWRKDVEETNMTTGGKIYSGAVRRCADELERLLKPRP